MIWFLFLWLPLCFLIAWAAGQKGRSGVGFFFLSLFLSPLLAGFILLIVPARFNPDGSPFIPSGHVPCAFCSKPIRAEVPRCRHCGMDQARARERVQQAAIAFAATQPATKQCPMCAETILAAARKCKHCGSDQPEESIAAVPAMGLCPKCRKPRAVTDLKCLYCDSIERVTG